jgi:hypothetical protein
VCEREGEGGGEDSDVGSVGEREGGRGESRKRVCLIAGIHRNQFLTRVSIRTFGTFGTI